MGQAMHTAKVNPNQFTQFLSIPWSEFVQRIHEINQRCEEVPDRDGRCFLFAVKRGSADSYIWKLNVRIYAIAKDGNGLITPMRVLNLSQFLTFHKSLMMILDMKESVDSLSVSLIQGRYDESEECVICMDRTSDSVLPCSHSFCFVCIEQWRAMEKNCCPVCRYTLRSDGMDTWMITDEQPNSEDLRDYVSSAAGAF